jgi:prophage antirepressor-like protein
MSAVTTFDFDDMPFRVLLRDGQPWFVLSDVCHVLDIANSRDAADRLDEDEKGVATTDTPGGPQSKTIVNESGLYSLILTSRKEGAKRFRKWVTAEVLPQIRRTGEYRPALPAEPDGEWRFKDQNIEDLKACISLLREVRLNHGKQAAQKLWGKLAPPLPSIETIQDNLLHAGDSVSRFAREMIVSAPGARLRANTLFECYCAWCKAMHLPAESWTGFGRRLVVLGFAKRKTGGVWYRDIQIRGFDQALIAKEG